jgi:hypothetical protein
MNCCIKVDFPQRLTPEITFMSCLSLNEINLFKKLLRFISINSKFVIISSYCKNLRKSITFCNRMQKLAKSVSLQNKVAPRIEWARSECEAPAVGKPRNATIPMHLRHYFS